MFHLFTERRLVTQEGGALVERQTKALFGDPKALQRQMQEAVGKDIASLDDLMERVQKVSSFLGVQLVLEILLAL